MAKRLITFGCSHTKDHYRSTWANYLSELMGLELSNQGARGAGVDFVTKRLIDHDITGDDLVFIMLPSRDRFDWYIDNDSPLRQEALDIASWQDGKQSSLIQEDGTLSDQHGFVLTGSHHRGVKQYWFKYFYSERKVNLDFWHNVYQIQCHLHRLGVEYYITSAHDLDKGIEQKSSLTHVKIKAPRVINHIDFDRFICWKKDRGLLDFCLDNGYGRVDDYHPVPEGHAKFAEFLYQQLQEKQRNKPKEESK